MGPDGRSSPEQQTNSHAQDWFSIIKIYTKKKKRSLNQKLDFK